MSAHDSVSVAVCAKEECGRDRLPGSRLCFGCAWEWNVSSREDFRAWCAAPKVRGYDSSLAHMRDTEDKSPTTWPAYMAQLG